MGSMDTFKTKASLKVAGKSYAIYRLNALSEAGFDVASLPYSLKILLENLLRTENGVDITADDIPRHLRGHGFTYTHGQWFGNQI